LVLLFGFRDNQYQQKYPHLLFVKSARLITIYRNYIRSSR